MCVICTEMSLLGVGVKLAQLFPLCKIEPGKKKGNFLLDYLKGQCSSHLVPRAAFFTQQFDYKVAFSLDIQWPIWRVWTTMLFMFFQLGLKACDGRAASFTLILSFFPDNKNFKLLLGMWPARKKKKLHFMGPA